METDKAPERIWLQVGEDGEAFHGDTWCEEKIGEHDIEYIRLDLHEKEIAEKDAEIARLKEESKRFEKEAADEMLVASGMNAQIARLEAEVKRLTDQQISWKTISESRADGSLGLVDELRQSDEYRLRFPKEEVKKLRNERDDFELGCSERDREIDRLDEEVEKLRNYIKRVRQFLDKFPMEWQPLTKHTSVDPMEITELRQTFPDTLTDQLRESDEYRLHFPKEEK